MYKKSVCMTYQVEKGSICESDFQDLINDVFTCVHESLQTILFNL